MKRVSILLLLVVFILGAGLIYYRSTNPSGVYYDSGMACGYAYWVVRNGRVCIETPETNIFICTYSKSDGRWITSSNSQSESFTLKPSLLGIKLETYSYGKYLPRYGFSWLFKETNSYKINNGVNKMPTTRQGT